MNDLQPIIEQLTEIIKGTKDLAITQSPDFIRQFLIKSMLDQIGWLVLSGPIVLCAVRWSWFIKKNWDDFQNEECFFHPFGCGILLILSSLAVVINITNLAVIYFSPKVWVVQELIRAIVPSK